MDVSTDSALLSSSVPLASIDGDFLSIDTSLLSLSHSVSIATALFDLTAAIALAHNNRTLASLHASLSLLSASHAQAEGDWSSLSQRIEAETAALTAQSASLSASLASSRSSLSSLSQQLHAAEHSDAQHILTLLSRDVCSDLTLLPRSVLSHLIPFLRPRELAVALRVNHRWHRALDDGGLWKLLCIRLIRQILHQRTQQSASSAFSASSAPAASAPPPSFSLTFTPAQLNPKPKSMLSRAEVLKHALTLHQRAVDVVMREFETLSSRQGDEGNEKSLLRVMVDMKRDEVGRKQVMIGEMLAAAERVQRERAARARQLKALEAAMMQERERKRLMNAEHAEAQRWFEQRASRVRAIEGGGSRKEERDSLLQKREVLRRGVDSLKRDIARATEERDEYEFRVSDMRAKVRQVLL